MEVQELETVRNTIKGHLINELDKLADRDPKLRTVASRSGPFARTCHRDSDSRAELGPDSQLGGL